MYHKGAMPTLQVFDQLLYSLLKGCWAPVSSDDHCSGTALEEVDAPS